jgi:ribonucleoside-diphosphate reductase alpha chain
MNFVEHRFELAASTIDELKSKQPHFGFGAFGEVVFYKSYARTKTDNSVETWNDVVIRVVEGVFSIRKDWYKRNHIPWNEDFWQVYARNFARSLFNMEWLPPGRGLWAMGSDFIYKRGAMALYNCAFTRITNKIGEDIEWLMDSLMHGVGVGFAPERDYFELKTFPSRGSYDYVIPDTREGWCLSTRLLIDSYLYPNQETPNFKYHEIRKAGEPIKGFGGTASGPMPLMQLHTSIDQFFDMYQTETWYDSVLLKTDLANAVGVCVVAGNVRRSAEIAIGPLQDHVFLNLKDYNVYPHRTAHGWMSNNSVVLESDHDFESLGKIAERVIKNGEPGFINKRNMVKGRLNKKGYAKPDEAIGFNPCGEIPLEHREVCNVAETLPTRCASNEDWLKACEYATVYMSTVSLLSTHQPTTNQIVAKNRRIGLSIIDITGWQHEIGTNKVIKWMREGYDIVTKTNQWVNSEAGVPEAIRKTTVKPGGTVPKIAGRTAGMGFPNFIFTLRRLRVSRNTQIYDLLIEAGIPHEPDVNDEYTEVFEFPIKQGPAKPAERATLWEQAMNLVMIQREWADNAVSNTLNFRPKWRLTGDIIFKDKKTLEEFCLDNYGTTESGIYFNGKIKLVFDDLNLRKYQFDPNHEEDDIEPVLSMIAPLTKSVSLLPHSPKGIYKQMPEEGITEEEYKQRVEAISSIDWSILTHNTPEPDMYCTGETCEVR